MAPPSAPTTNTATRSERRPPEVARVVTDGLSLEVRVGGKPDAVPVLLLHGFPQTFDAWADVAGGLEDAGYRTLAPDQRGYALGARPTPRRSYRLRHLVDDAVAVIDQLADAGPVHVIGHDWGGVVAWALAAWRPERLLSVTTLTTPHPAAMARSTFGLQALRSVYALAFQVPVLPEVLLGAAHAAPIGHLLRMSGLPSEQADAYQAALAEPGALHGALNWYRAADLVQLARLGPSLVPTLFVWADRDPALGPRAAARTADHVTGRYRFVVLQGASHWLPERHADEILPLLVDHLRAADRSRAARYGT